MSGTGVTGVDAHDSAGIAAHATALKTADYNFVAQYIGIDPSKEDGGASVTPSQVKTDLAAGLQIVSIFETNGMSSTNYQTGAATYGWETYLTEAQGETDAAAAYQAAEAVGQPSGSAIYFAMDFDPAATDGTIDEATALSRVNTYFSGIKAYFASLSGGPDYEVGVYGAGATLQSVTTAGLAQFTWLSLSTGWDGYSINGGAGTTHGWTMIQSSSNPVDGVSVDQDQTDSAAFGAWNSATSAMPCYVAGTRILTDRGEVAVEELLPGTRVVLAGGGTAPVVWVGQNRVDCQVHPCPELVWPVRVRASAFGDRLPQRDLMLSPDHALYLEGVLIPVKYLLNGASIVQERKRSVHYFHVELPRHAVLLAEGLAAESYLDVGNRKAFADGAEHIARHLQWEDACAQLCHSGPAIAVTRRHLRARLQDAGWRAGLQTEWFVTAGGNPLERTVQGLVHRFTLPPGIGEIRIFSSTGVPAGIDPASEDCRTLGIRVDAVFVDDEPIPLDSPAFAGGFHPEERGRPGAWRWTNGEARLRLPSGCRKLELLVGETMPGWVTRPGVGYFGLGAAEYVSPGWTDRTKTVGISPGPNGPGAS